MAKIKLLVVYVAVLALHSAFGDDDTSVSKPLFPFVIVFFFNYFRVFRQNEVPVEKVPYISPLPSKVGVYLAEHFDDPSSFGKKWIKSNSKKPDVDEDLAQYDGMQIITIIDKKFFLSCPKIVYNFFFFTNYAVYYFMLHINC